MSMDGSDGFQRVFSGQAKASGIPHSTVDAVPAAEGAAAVAGACSGVQLGGGAQRACAGTELSTVVTEKQIVTLVAYVDGVREGLEGFKQRNPRRGELAVLEDLDKATARAHAAEAGLGSGKERSE